MPVLRRAPLPSLFDESAGEPNAPLPDLAALPTVPYDLPADRAAWNGLALVGEAPGREEVRQNRPFVGRSGQLLDAALAEAGIERARCLVANVFRRQPPGNKVGHFFLSRRAATQEGAALAEDRGRFGSSWCRAEAAGDIACLETTLKAWRPRAIIALGRTPLWALTGQSGLLTLVGQRLEARFDPNLAVFPTFHPSFILRGNWGLQPEWRANLKGAAQHVA